MYKLSGHAIRMLEIVDANDISVIGNRQLRDIAIAVYDLILQVQMLQMADRKTEPQTCANGCKWLNQDGECTEPHGECHIEYRTEVDEPQTDCAWAAPDEPRTVPLYPMTEGGETNEDNYR